MGGTLKLTLQLIVYFCVSRRSLKAWSEYIFLGIANSHTNTPINVCLTCTQCIILSALHISRVWSPFSILPTNCCHGSLWSETIITLVGYIRALHSTGDVTSKGTFHWGIWIPTVNYRREEECNCSMRCSVLLGNI